MTNAFREAFRLLALCAMTAAGAEGTAPSPTPPSALISFDDYRIAPADLLFITIVNEPSLDKVECRVSGEGTVSFPFIQEVKLVEKTPAEAGRLLRERLMKEEYFVNPQVIVNVKEYKKRVVTILGQVQRQGVIEFPNEQSMNLLEAIGHAGGFTDKAKKSTIIISRGEEKITFNYTAYTKNSDKSRLPLVKPGDVIFIDELFL